MSRQLFGLEQGLAVYAENGDSYVGLLRGSTAPGGEAFTDNAEAGSFYHRTNGQVWFKKFSGTGADKWVNVDNQFSLDNVTTVQTLDEVLVDRYLAVTWDVVIRLTSAPQNVIALKIFAAHDGHAGADAATVDDTQFAKLKIRSVTATVAISLNGTGATQTMRLTVLAGSAVFARAKRVSTVDANGV